MVFVIAGNQFVWVTIPHLRLHNVDFCILCLWVSKGSCETWSLTLKDEHELRVFENRVVRRIFGPKRYGVKGGWRKLHND
jgi:hypothetical protein